MSKKVTLLFWLCALVLAGSYFWASSKIDGSVISEIKTATLGTHFPSIKSDSPDFTLIDQDGNSFDQSRLNGKTSIFFFGFTHCGGMCPMAMASLTSALNTLDNSQLQNIVPIFVTIDPERDDPKRLKEYLSSFHPSFVGLTGDPKKLKDLSKSFGVFAQKMSGTEENAKDYNVDHSGFIYILDKKRQFIDMFLYNTGVEKISERIKKTFE